MRLMMASMPKEEDIQNAPRIHKAALLCILLSTLRGYKSSTLL